MQDGQISGAQKLLSKLRSARPLARFKGHIDLIDAGLIQGWSVDMRDLTRPVALEILVDGKVEGHTIASLPRPDLARTFSGSADHGFAWAAGTISEGPHRIAIRPIGASSPIHEMDAVIDKMLPSSTEAAIPLSQGHFEGDISFRHGAIHGWVWDDREPDTPLHIHLYIDGQYIDQGLADMPRDDLRREGKGDGCHGFRFILPEH